MTKLILLALPLIASAGSISFTGDFGRDNNLVGFSFDLASAGDVTLRTWSFAGGIDANGFLIVGGGFAPVLSVFDAGGALLAMDKDGGAGACGARAVDAVSGFCWDAFLNLNLAAGSYVLTLTEDDNTPLGPTLGDGFTRDGAGNFTGPEFGGPLGSIFILADGSQRTSSWEVDVTTPDSSVPEPGSGAVVVIGVGILSLRHLIRATPSFGTYL